MYVPPEVLHQLPLLALFIIPISGAYCGLKMVNMKSAIHFQQGTKGSSAWRAALAMTTISTPSFAFWCLLMRGVSALTYQLGSSLAIVVVFSSVAGILHYVPSPSLFAYPQLRFFSITVRLLLSTLHTVVTLSIILLILLHSSSLLDSISFFSLHLSIALMGFFPLFGIVFSGYSSIMTITLLFNTFCILSGIGIFLCFGIREITSFEIILPTEFSVSDSILSLCVGFIVSLYQLSSSSLFYQVYFPIPTLYKLRLTFVFYGVFQLFSSILIFLIVSLFFAFMDKRCSIVQYTYQSFFQFANHTVPHPVLAYVVMVSFLCTFAFSIQWLYISITTHIWEEFIKVHFKEVGSTRQLCCVQSVLLVICAISVMLVCLIRLLHLPYDNYTPIVVFVILSLSAAMCGVFICGYFLPFCNSKGALVSLLISVISTICILYLFVSHNQLPELKNDCTVESSRNTTVQIRSFNMEKMILMVSYMPVQSHPIFVFVIALLVCPIVSLFTGGQDQMRLDWNLVVLPCSGSLSVRTTYGKRPFVESESFRYAQHTAGPGLLKNQR